MKIFRPIFAQSYRWLNLKLDNAPAGVSPGRWWHGQKPATAIVPLANFYSTHLLVYNRLMIESPIFESVLFKSPGKGGWTFAPIPAEYAPSRTYGWGRTPVVATVDGKTWETSVWKDTKSGKTLLAVPKKIRNGKGDGDTVEVSFRLREPE